MRASRVQVACVLTLFLGTTVEAATVNVVSGPISVNKGNGFKAIRHSATAMAGDLVLAGTGGSAEITYDDGCKQTVNSGETVSISAPSPCKMGTLDDPMSNLVLTGLVGAAVAGGIIAVTKDSSRPASP